MKKLIVPIALIGGMLLMFACGNNSNKATEKDTSEQSEEVQTPDGPKTSGKLTPDKIKPDEAIPVDELHELVFKWESIEEVTVTGYCDFFFDEDAIGNNVDLLGTPEADIANIECSMKESYDEKFNKSVPVTIKGKVEGVRFDRIQLVECELITTGETLEPTGKYIDPFIYSGENIAVQDFFDSYFGWIDVEVSVEGYYKSTTTSTTSYGVTTRLDLSGEEKEAGCRLIEGTEAPEIVDRAGVIIKGVIKGDLFSDVLLEECTVVNR
jgi:hypothetical protein